MVQFGSRTTSGERLRSNLQQVGPNKTALNTENTAPPASDTWLGSIRFDGGSAAPVFDGRRLPAYKHPGDMALVDDVLFVPVDQPVSAVGSTAPGFLPADTGYLLRFDVSDDPTNPVPLRALPLDHAIDNVAVTRRSDKKYLIWSNGNCGTDMNVYTTTSTDLRAADLGLTVVERWQPRTCISLSYPPFISCSGNRDALVPAPPDGPEWPTGSGAYQSSTFLRDSHGTLYLIGMRHPMGLPDVGEDYADLYRVNDLGSRLELTRLARRLFYCKFAFAGRVCNFAAANNAYVSPSGELILYSSPHHDEEKFTPPAVRMAEFRDRDVLHNSNPLLAATATASGCQVGGSPTVTLLGPDAPAADRPWVELYDDAGFKDRFIMVDYDDQTQLELYNFKHLDGFNDKTSSVRWRAPKGCNVVLYEHDNFNDNKKGRRVVLLGTGKTQTISNLNADQVKEGVVAEYNSSGTAKATGVKLDFGDKTSSLQWQETTHSVTFTNGLATLGLRFASAFGAAPLRTLRLQLPDLLRPTHTGADNLVLPSLRVDGHRLLRRYITLRRTELTVRLRDARSARLRWNELRASPTLVRALRARLEGDPLNLLLLLTDANGATQRLQLVLQPRLPPEPQAPTFTG